MKSPISSLWQLSPLLVSVGLFPAGSCASEAGHEHHQQASGAVAAGSHDMHEHRDQGDRQGAGDADDPHAHHRAMLKKAPEPASMTKVDLLDRTLLDQDGNDVKFVSDVIGDRIVVMDFVYTTCTTICPVISAVFGQVQQKLGDRLGDDVVLVSVTVDPVRDTPRRLKAYAARHKAGPDWVWLTGQKRTVDEVLDGLGAYSTNFENHPAMVLVGDGRSGDWRRFFGFPSPDRIVEQVDVLRAARTAVAGGES